MESAGYDEDLMPLEVGPSEDRLGFFDVAVNQESEDLVGALLLAGGEEPLKSGRDS